MTNVNGGPFNAFHNGNVPNTAPPRIHYMTPQQQQNHAIFGQASQMRANGNDVVLSLANTLERTIESLADKAQSSILNLADKARQDTNTGVEEILSHVKEM